jgi:hypothetical protein
MARRTGKSTIIYLMRRICRLVGLYGVSAVVTYTGSPAIGSALQALQAACHAWEAQDDNPGEIDDTAPVGPEDPGGGGGGGSW